MTLQQRLEQAENAYHRLMTGTATVEIKKDNRTVTYYRATAHQLKNYIDELRVQLNGNKSSRRRPPMGVIH